MVYFDRIFGLCGSFPAWDKSRNSRIKPTSYGNIYYIRNDKFSDDGTVAIYLLVRNIPILMADEVVVMTAKPKTGKMTEIEEELLETLNKIDSEETRNIIIGYVEALRTQYKEQGIAEGRAELKEELKELKLYFDSCMLNVEKQAYANGFKEGEIKGLSESITVKGKSHLSYYQQGYALGQSDLSARLMSKELIEKMCEIWYVDIYYKNHKEDIFKKGRRDGMKCFIEKALAEATKEGGEK